MAASNYGVMDLPTTEGRDHIPYTDMIPSFNLADPGLSIIESVGFKTVYNTRDKIENFRATKSRRPAAELLSNEEFMTIIKRQEPGSVVDWNQLRADFEKLKPRHEHLCSQTFEHVEDFFKRYDEYLQAAANLVNHDVWYNTIKRFYEPFGDVALLKLFPTTYDDYVDEMARFTNNRWQDVFKTMWITFRDEANETAKKYIEMKGTFETAESLSQISFLAWKTRELELAQQRAREQRRQYEEWVRQQDEAVRQAGELIRL